MAIAGKKVVAVVEARMTSSRLPGKVLLPAGGKPLLQILCERLKQVERLDEIIIATTVNSTDDPIVELAGKIGVSVFRGSEEDVLKRVADCLRNHRADICVEVTGDCPLVDPTIVDECLDAFTAGQDTAYVSNSDPQRSVPAGLDVQVFQAAALLQLDREAIDPADREHVSYGFYRPEAGARWHPKFVTHKSTVGTAGLWISLDYREDYELIKAAHEALSGTNPFFKASELATWIRSNPELHNRCLRHRPGWGEK